jgi:Cyclic nucleotide-binding domain
VYIVERGFLEVSVNGKVIRTLTSGALFGELALLFDARRSATVMCLTECKLWSLNRKTFKMIQRNAVNLAMMTRTRRFLAVPEFAALPSSTLSRLMATLTPMTYNRGDNLYTTGKCNNKIMLIEEGTVVIKVPQAMQHLPLEEIERVVGIIRPLQNMDNIPNAYSNQQLSALIKSDDGDEMDYIPEDEAEEPGKVKQFKISEGCVIGMNILLGKIGSSRGWVWIDAKVDGKVKSTCYLLFILCSDFRRRCRFSLRRYDASSFALPYSHPLSNYPIFSLLLKSAICGRNAPRHRHRRDRSEDGLL